MENQQKKSPRYVRVTGTITAHTSAMHGELHQQLYSLVAAQDKQKLHLTDELLKAWNDLIAQEVELNNAQQDTELTAKMQQLDDDRDALITQIFSAIRSNRRSPVKALREPAERLVKLVDSYKGIQREVLQAESMHINGMLKDLAKYSTETAALGGGLLLRHHRSRQEAHHQFGEQPQRRARPLCHKPQIEQGATGHRQGGGIGKQPQAHRPAAARIGRKGGPRCGRPVLHGADTNRQERNALRGARRQHGQDVVGTARG